MLQMPPSSARTTMLQQRDSTTSISSGIQSQVTEEMPPVLIYQQVEQQLQNVQSQYHHQVHVVRLWWKWTTLGVGTRAITKGQNFDQTKSDPKLVWLLKNKATEQFMRGIQIRYVFLSRASECKYNAKRQDWTLAGFSSNSNTKKWFCIWAIVSVEFECRG